VRSSACPVGTSTTQATAEKIAFAEIAAKHTRDNEAVSTTGNHLQAYSEDLDRLIDQVSLGIDNKSGSGLSKEKNAQITSRIKKF
jgi:hypothetical protein